MTKSPHTHCGMGTFFDIICCNFYKNKLLLYTRKVRKYILIGG